MTKLFDVTDWLRGQVGRSRADVLLDVKAKSAVTRQAVVEANRGRINMQQRAVISAASKIDARVGRFLTFATKLDKRPMGISVADWAIYHEIAQAWVESGCVKLDVLKLFEK